MLTGPLRCLVDIDACDGAGGVLCTGGGGGHGGRRGRIVIFVVGGNPGFEWANAQFGPLRHPPCEKKKRHTCVSEVSMLAFWYTVLVFTSLEVSC